MLLFNPGETPALVNYECIMPIYYIKFTFLITFVVSGICHLHELNLLSSFLHETETKTVALLLIRADDVRFLNMQYMYIQSRVTYLTPVG